MEDFQTPKVYMSGRQYLVIFSKADLNQISDS